MWSSLFEKTVCLFFVILFLSYLAVLSASPVKPEGFGWGLSTIGIPAYELAFFCILTLTIWKLQSSRLQYLVVLMCIFIPMVSGSIYLVQLISIMISGKYITVLAMENLGEVSYVTNQTTIAMCLGMVCLVGIIIFAAISEARKCVPSKFSGRFVLVGLTLIFLMGFVYSERRQLVDQVNNLNVPFALDINFAPMIKMYSTYKDFSEVDIGAERAIKFIDEVLNGDAESPFKVDIMANFPFQQAELSAGPLPFFIDRPKEPMNVIVLFLEGLSARALGYYGGPYRDLTPNLNRFAAQSVTVDNYYNHTAATYRGIQGSLSSGFPSAGGANGWEISDGRAAELSSISYATLPIILGARGYNTRIYSPHSRSLPFDDFLTAVGFAEVITPEDVLPDSPPDFLSDKELFTAMATALQARDQAGDQAPFFWSSYNIGSHAFRDTPVGAKKYGDGRNSALNRFHELDESVKIFLNAFEASTFVDNTLIIITSDHSSYAEPPVVEAFSDSPKYTTHFIDQIPFIIRFPGIIQPMRFENGVRTSLDLAPTVLHLMGVTDVEHAFLGTSIFDAQFKPEVNWGMIGDTLYRINSEGVSVVTPEVANTHEQIMGNAVMYYYQLQRENRIFSLQTP